MEFRVTGYPDEVLHLRDPKCPYICEAHMQENEALATGVNRLDESTRIEYPCTHKWWTYGWSEYEPLEDRHTLLYNANTVAVTIGEDVNADLIRYLANHPEAMGELTPRRFEQLVAAIFRNRGFHVELTPATRDGGIDLYAARNDSFGELLYVIECKRYRSSRKVGVEIVQRLYGVAVNAGATKGLVVTTSTFTKDAVDFASPLRFQLSLHDYEALRSWLRSYMTA
jgi:hypothetical protein